MSVLAPIPVVTVFQRPLRVPVGVRFGVHDALHPNGHRGVDFPAPEGTPIRSAAWGRVVATYPRSPVLGNVTVVASRLKSSRRVVYLGYCHQNRILVKQGEKVAIDQVIGQVGETGSAAKGDHLHLTASWEPEGVFYGNVFDALTFIATHAK